MLGLWGLQGSAYLKGKQVFLTVVNPDINQKRETEVVIPGAKIKTEKAKIFSSPNIRDYNDLDNPDTVQPPVSSQLPIINGDLVYEFEPASVTSIKLGLE